MKQLTLSLLIPLCILFMSSCNKGQIQVNYKGPFPNEAILNSLNKGQSSLNAETVAALTRKYQFQKRAKLKHAYGVVIPKSTLNIAINGIMNNTPQDPTNSKNYDKWDFMICYPGLSINSIGDESMKPAIFFYKGGTNEQGEFVPVGDPVEDIEFPTGGGGPGKGGFQTPPPN